jgi:hypothetical protein
MNTIDARPAAPANRRDFKKWLLCGVAVGSFLAGALIATRIAHAREISADNHRIFELMVYHTIADKAPALESIFRDVSKLQDKHDLKVVGYWVPDDDSPWANTFVYLVAHPSREKAKTNWAALHADPAFPKYRKQAAEIIDKVDEQYRVDEVYMRPTDYSAMK